MFAFTTPSRGTSGDCGVRAYLPYVGQAREQVLPAHIRLFSLQLPVVLEQRALLLSCQLVFGKYYAAEAFWLVSVLEHVKQTREQTLPAHIRLLSLQV